MKPQDHESLLRAIRPPKLKLLGPATVSKSRYCSYRAAFHTDLCLTLLSWPLLSFQFNLRLNFLGIDTTLPGSKHHSPQTPVPPRHPFPALPSSLLPKCYGSIISSHYLKYSQPGTLASHLPQFFWTPDSPFLTRRSFLCGSTRTSRYQRLPSIQSAV